MKTPESSVKIKNYSAKKGSSLESMVSSLNNVNMMPATPKVTPSDSLGRVMKMPNNIKLDQVSPSDLSRISKAPNKIELDKIPSSLEAKITTPSNRLLRKIISTVVKGNGRTEKQVIIIPALYMASGYVSPNPDYPDTTGYVAGSEYTEI